MYNITSVSNPVELCEFTHSSRLMAQFKVSAGTEMLDVRTWVKWIQDQEFHPSRKNSIMLERKYARSVFTKLLEILDAQEGIERLNKQGV